MARAWFQSGDLGDLSHLCIPCRAPAGAALISPPLPVPVQVSWGVPTPLLLRGMPQFTFACFCGLHGFCKMKRKKEESSAEQETAV